MKSFLKIFSRKTRQEKFSAMLRPHIGGLYKQAYHYTGNSFDAEDLVQDVLLKTFQKMQELKKVKNLPAWLNRCMYYRFVDRHRAKQRQPDFEDINNPELEMQLPCESLSEDHYFKLQLHRGLEKLSLQQRAVINLHDLNGYSLPEISIMMDVPVGTLKSHLHRGRKQLEKYLRLTPEMLATNPAHGDR